MATNEQRIDEVERRVTRLEIDGGKLDERLNSLLNSLVQLKWIVYAITILSLGTVIYGAVGEKGFNAVRNATSIVQAQVK